MNSSDNYTDQDGFEIEIFEDYNGEKWLKKVKGDGSVFRIPEGITAIKGIETRYLDSHFQCTTWTREIDNSPIKTDENE